MTDMPTDVLHLARWTATSGSNARSRGAVVIAAGEHEWRASSEGIGAIDALYRAVDEALGGVLTGHPRLLAYDIHALGEGTDTIGAVAVRIAPPDVGGERGAGEYRGEARGPNIIAASIEAYIAAINLMLSEAHWEGATEAAGNRRGAAVPAGTAREQRADLDETEAPHDTTAWFER
jgi:LeuA allosteric (dimerisation) domain